MTTLKSVTRQPAERPIVLALIAKSITKELGNIVNVGSVLLGKEDDNIWRLIGGHMQPKEAERFLTTRDELEKRRIVLKALRRELGEEVNITIQEIHFFKCIPDRGLTSGEPVTAYIYIVHPHGDITVHEVAREILELRWIDDPAMLNCQKKGERIAPLVCKVLKLLRTKGIH